MKIALLNDTHFGARSDSPIFNEYFYKFLETNFFPYLKQNNITTLIHLGDVVDRRKFVNFKIAHDIRNRFFNRLWKEKIDTHIILGNHDTYYKNTNLIFARNTAAVFFLNNNLRLCNLAQHPHRCRPGVPRGVLQSRARCSDDVSLPSL